MPVFELATVCILFMTHCPLTLINKVLSPRLSKVCKKFTGNSEVACKFPWRVHGCYIIWLFWFVCTSLSCDCCCSRCCLDYKNSLRSNCQRLVHSSKFSRYGMWEPFQMSTMGGHGKRWTGESDERDWSCVFLILSIISCSLFVVVFVVVVLLLISVCTCRCIIQFMKLIFFCTN